MSFRAKVCALCRPQSTDHGKDSDAHADQQGLSPGFFLSEDSVSVSPATPTRIHSIPFLSSPESTTHSPTPAHTPLHTQKTLPTAHVFLQASQSTKARQRSTLVPRYTKSPARSPVSA